MLLAVILIVVVLLALSLATLPSKLHLFERLFVGLAFNYMHMTQSSVFHNLKLLNNSKDMQEIFSYILVRYFVYTMLLLFLLELYLTLHAGIAKVVLILLGAGVFTVLQFATKWTGMLRFSNTVGLWYYAIWLGFLVAALLLTKLFRRFALKEVELP